MTDPEIETDRQLLLWVSDGIFRLTLFDWGHEGPSVRFQTYYEARAAADICAHLFSIEVEDFSEKAAA